MIFVLNFILQASKTHVNWWIIYQYNMEVKSSHVEDVA